MLFGKAKNKPANDEYARVIEWEPRWNAGAPMPQVFSNGLKLYLIYFINTPHPHWNGKYTVMVDNTGDTNYPLALVEFSGHTFRFGIANDEVFNGLPLWGKGLVHYGAHIIENSKWREEIRNIHKVHPRHDPNNASNRKHYMLLFHDEILEVIAEGYKIEVFNTTFSDLAIEVVKRMNKD